MRSGSPPRPIPDSYWVQPGRLLAGEYPGSRHHEEARRKLRQLLEAGVTYFLDLTEAGEYGLEPYTPLLAEDAQQRVPPAVHRRMAIPDGGTPSAAEMRRILDTIDAALQKGHCIYVHCWGGIGRTGTMVGCCLVRHGLGGQEALDLIARRRAGTPDGYRRSPETRAQARFILDWPAGG